MIEQPKIFQVGDRVKWCGVEGVVIRLYDKLINVIFSNKEDWYFHTDGRWVEWHTESSLILVERPKKKVKKKVEYWINIYPDGTSHYAYTSRTEADVNSRRSDRIRCDHVTGEYECEE